MQDDAGGLSIKLGEGEAVREVPAWKVGLGILLSSTAAYTWAFRNKFRKGVAELSKEVADPLERQQILARAARQSQRGLVGEPPPRRPGAAIRARLPGPGAAYPAPPARGLHRPSERLRRHRRPQRGVAPCCCAGGSRGRA